MNNEIIFYIALITFSGLVFGRLAKFIKLPNVTGYLIAGLLLGPSLLNLIPANAVTSFSVISDIALGFIAFSVGSEFKLSYFKKVGMAPIIIAIAESFGAIILVTLVLVLFGFDLRLSILLGAIAAATAPAQTLMVIQQYKAHGSLTSMLMSVVALDDAVALIGFGFAVTIVNAMTKHTTNILLSILSPFFEVFLSLAIGAAVSLIMVLFLRWFKKPSNRICVLISFVLFTTWIANITNASPLLACMGLGAMLANLIKDIDPVIAVSHSLTPPLFMIFFVISGAAFDVRAIAGVGVIGLIYVVMRVAGKYLGAYFGGIITKSEKKICRYLGPTLMPQAGVALGLVIVAGNAVPQYAKEINLIILSSTFIYSLIGPIFAKYALVKSGEIVLPPKKVIEKSS